MKQFSDFIAQIKQNRGYIVLFGILFSSLSFLFVVVNERNFMVSTDYLVVQNSQNSTDTYALAKSAEYIGKILSEGIRSELFINEVVKTGKVNQEFLPFDKRDKLKAWEKTVEVGQNANLGIISVSVFDNNKRQAEGIAESISEVLTTKNNLFRGDSQNIEVRILSGPVVEKNPSISKIFVTMVAGFLFGTMLSMLWIFRESGDELEKYRAKLLHKEKEGWFAEDNEYIESLAELKK